jgi:hypothetical protein
MAQQLAASQAGGNGVTCHFNINRLGRRPAKKMPGRDDTRARQKELRYETDIRARLRAQAPFTLYQ